MILGAARAAPLILHAETGSSENGSVFV